MQKIYQTLGIGSVVFLFSFGIPSIAFAGPAGVDSGLELWFSADSGAKTTGGVDATDGQAIITWEDQSSEGRDATRQDATGALFSTTGLNYNPTLEFNNNNYTFSDTGLPAGSSDRSIFVVASTNDIGAWRYVLGAGTFGGGNGFDFGNRSGSGVVFITTHSSQEAQTGSWTPLGTARLAYGAVTSGTLYLGVNGGALVSGGSGVNTVLDGSANIGANSGGSERWYGSISEVIMYDRTVSDTERQRINSYLALKYGFSLDQTTPQSYLASGSNLMWDKDAADASTYDNGLFGIGRDDSSSLAQVKSRGQTSTNIIILEAEDEGQNGNPNFQDIADLEFLVIGDNGGSASWTTTGAPSGYSILDRQWKKQEQGDVGRVKLDFDIADADFDVPAALDGDNYYFIYDTDNDGSLSDETPLAMSDQGNDLWRTTVDFGSGGIFTLASTDNPAISSLSPADNATNVGANTNLIITFSRNVNADSGTVTIRKSSDDSIFEAINVQGGQVTGNGTNTITINPNNMFASNTGYYVQIGSAAFKDGSDNYFGGITSKEAWNFTTETINSPSPTPTLSSASNSSKQTAVISNTSACSDPKPSNTSDLFQIDVNAKQARLYFTPVRGDVTNYFIAYGYKDGDERFGVMTGLGKSTGVLSYMVNDLDPNMTYYFKVRPQNGCMTGDWSNSMKITTQKKFSGGTVFYKNFLAHILSFFPRHITEIKEKPVLGIKTQNISQSQPCTIYTVQPGDTLWKIAKKELGSGFRYREIVEESKLKSTSLRTGQKITFGC